MILEAAKKSIIEQQNLTNEAINEIVINQEEIDKQREAFEIKQTAKQREENFADQMKN